MNNYSASDTTDQLTYGNLSSCNNLSKYKDSLKFRLAAELQLSLILKAETEPCNFCLWMYKLKTYNRTEPTDQSP